jgi:hypothetical protein
MTTPNTPANGGQILTDERLNELWNTALVRAGFEIGNADVAHMNQLRHFARAIEADLRASLAAPAIPTVDRNAVLEEAARVCDAQATEPECPERAEYCAESIRALKSAGPASVPKPFVPPGYANEAEWLRSQLAEAKTYIKAHQAVLAERDATIASVAQPAAQVALREALAYIAAYSYEEDLCLRTHANLLGWALSVVNRANKAIATPATVKTAEG